MAENKVFSREGYLKEQHHFFHLKDTAGQERGFHFHDFDKLVILLGGKVDYLLEDERLELRPGSILFVPHHVIHKAEIDKSQPYERVIIYVERSFFESLNLSTYMILPGNKEWNEILALIAEYENLKGDDKFGAKELKDGIIIRILVTLGRLFASSEEPKKKKKYDPKIEETLSYINEHLSDRLDVDSLAGMVYLSRSHFMRLFKLQTGSTVHAYIRQKRLVYAARLLRSGVPATEASEKAGFTDYSTFHRAFTGTYSITPSEISRQ